MDKRTNKRGNKDDRDYHNSSSPTSFRRLNKHCLQPDSYKEKKERYLSDTDSSTKQQHEDERNKGYSANESSRFQERPGIYEKAAISTSTRDFNFLQHKHSLNKIFFRDQDFIKRGTKDYDDFWMFVEKYQAFHWKKKVQNMTVPSCTSDNSLGIPTHYNKQFRINLTLKNQDVEDFIRKGRLADAEIDEAVTVERVKEFKEIFLHYMDFQQKQKLAKLKKVRADQENLPIFKYKSAILEMLKDHQVIVVAGDTGCGKSTQVPQYLLHDGYENIACTQPRRIACVSLSKRVGYETLNEYGTEVAFQVRFEKTKTRQTKILFLTEGLLLRQMTSDPHLSMYNIIVIDEVHERHIHTDFLLGTLKCLVRHRNDVKVILMSATINIYLFSHYFDDAPVVKIPGRLYPIEMEFCPIRKDADSKHEKLDPSPYLRIMQRIEKKYPKTERGDLLIFLSGLSEIMSVVEAAKTYSQQTKSWIVLPLHSALSVDEQDKVFDIAPEGVRKCIVSTNIAETSVTIDGVRFIVDSGKVKEMSFDPKCKMQRLQEFWISKASAEQRKGRAGRTGPGVCFRLYDEQEYEAFQEYTTPEIQRVTLDSLVLQMISMGLPDPRKFPFIEAPSMQSLEEAIIFLQEQGAILSDETLTPIGLMLSKLPVDVVIGKMLIMGSIFHMIDPVLSIAAAMSVQSPFTSKIHTDVDSVAARKSLESDHGDPFTLLNAFDEWIQVKAEGQATKKWCKRRGLEEQRFYEMTKLKRQFKELLQDHGLLEKVEAAQQKYLSSAERQQKHGERKRLGELRREQRKESKKRKVLKLEDEDYQISDGEEEDDKGSDIKDLEFRLSHNLQQMQETSNRSRHFTLRDINLLKIILCSGLYPQVAIADDCNSYKSNSEQAFHTKNKPFVLLHPTGVFSFKPELLHPKPDKADGKHDPVDLKGFMSNKHELLTFVSILETNKPYLVNTMRVPALQTVMLFSNNIDTNASCTRLICDGWLEVVIPNEESAQDIISSVIQLRATWQNLLKLRLEDTLLVKESERTTNPHAVKLERTLANKLSEFLSSDVRYTLRRVLAAEMKNIYLGPQRTGDELQNVLCPNSKPHPVKGGLQINGYLTHGCLVDDGTASALGEFTTHMQKHWTCPQCQASMIISITERLEHEALCQSQNISATKEEELADIAKERETQLNPLRKSYFCPSCDKQLQLTTTEILKHKKSHADG